MKLYKNSDLKESFSIPTYPSMSIYDDKIIVSQSELLSLLLERENKAHNERFQDMTNSRPIYSYHNFDDFLENYDFKSSDLTEKYGNNYIGKPFNPNEIYLAFQAFEAGRNCTPLINKEKDRDLFIRLTEFIAVNNPTVNITPNTIIFLLTAFEICGRRNTGIQPNLKDTVPIVRAMERIQEQVEK